jgi:hypothetical protein
MQARRALLQKLASITDWETSRKAPFQGESWLETRNTLYRFRDGMCVAVAGRDPKKHGRARRIEGMRLVGWLTGAEDGSLFGYDWTSGAWGVLWRPGEAGDGEAMALTSPTTTFVHGASSELVQALHDRTPPIDSQAFRRGIGRDPALIRPRLPSTPSYRSG